MSSELIINMLQANPTAGIAVGGAVLAGALGVVAYRALNGNQSPTASKSTKQEKKQPRSIKKKTNKKKKSTPPSSNDISSNSSSTASLVKDETPINLEDFVGDFPDTEDEEAARAESHKKRNAKKKTQKKKKKATGSSGKSDTDQAPSSNDKKSKAKKNPRDDGWETVTYKKNKQPKSQ